MRSILNRSAGLCALQGGRCLPFQAAQAAPVGVAPLAHHLCRSRQRGGMGGTPMANRKAGLPCVRGTRTPLNAAALLVHLATAPRKGRGLLLSGFAGEVLAPCSITSRPDKRLFLGARALFFIARNEGSSMVSDNYSCIHRIKYYWQFYHVPLGWRPRIKAAMISTDSGRFARWAKSMADNPWSFLSNGSAPASSSSFTADGVP